ncbi:anaerobic sulfatase maturase [Saccharicrinis sp. FJH54]|uniref:anaerobic sulfatase maturase n=1 Tax=Saccharicrinis sp. FJH54 TaxID=3344665 RepID=UPI0035D4DA5D
MAFKPLESVLIKPAGPDCNLGCTYCFYLEKEQLFTHSKTHRMSDEVLEMLIKQVMQQSGQSISINWQGGEPTLMGLEFYRKAMEYEKKYGFGKNVGNGLQTNGLLLDERWADFLNEYNWLVGLSLDGPEYIHNRYRLTPNSKPSHALVEEKARMLLGKGVEVNAMCCITSYSSGYAKELYSYFKELGISWMQFIPIVETDKDNPRKSAPFSLTAEQYGGFLVELFELWKADFVDGQPTTHIRDFDSVFYPYVGYEAPECTLRPECGVYTAVEHNGEVYSCDFFVEPKWKLGNIMDGDRLIDMLNSKKQTQFGLMKTKLPRKCQVCHWKKYCYGGCTKDRIKDPRDNGMPRFCQSFITFFEHADPFLRELGDKWKVDQAKMEAQQQQQQSNSNTYNAFGDFS